MTKVRGKKRTGLTKAEEMIGWTVRVRRSSEYADQAGGVGVVDDGNDGWVYVKFGKEDDYYENSYRIGLRGMPNDLVIVSKKVKKA